MSVRSIWYIFKRTVCKWRKLVWKELLQPSFVQLKLLQYFYYIKSFYQYFHDMINWAKLLKETPTFIKNKNFHWYFVSTFQNYYTNFTQLTSLNILWTAFSVRPEIVIKRCKLSVGLLLLILRLILWRSKACPFDPPYPKFVMAIKSSKNGSNSVITYFRTIFWLPTSKQFFNFQILLLR